MARDRRENVGLMPVGEISAVLRSKTESPRAEPPHGSPDPTHLAEVADFHLRVKVRIPAGIRRVVAWKFLIAMACYEGLDIQHYMVLWELHERIGRDKNPSLKKYQELYLFGEKVLREISSDGLSLKPEPLGKPATPVKCLPSSHAYYGMRNSANPTRGIRLVLTPPRRMPPKRYVGVGYRDKGTLSDTLSWQSQMVVDDSEQKTSLRDSSLAWESTLLDNNQSVGS